MATEGAFQGVNSSGQPYEHDERWSAVDRYALQHLHQNHPYAEALVYAAELSMKEGLPNIEVSPLQGKFLALQCQLINAKRILEVGTLGGYSSIWLASTGPDVTVTTIEIDPHHAEVARRAINNAGLSGRITVVEGAGVDVLPKIREEVEAGSLEKYDMVFIDADKQNNLNYLNESLRMCRSRALIIVDNVVRKGQLASAEAAEKDERVLGARKVVEAAGKDDRVLSATLMQTVGEKNYDGFLMCVAT